MMASWSFLNFQTGQIWLFWAYLFVVWQLSSSLHWQSSDIFHKSTPLKSTETVKKERQMRNSWIESPLKNVLTLTSKKGERYSNLLGKFWKKRKCRSFSSKTRFLSGVSVLNATGTLTGLPNQTCHHFMIFLYYDYYNNNSNLLFSFSFSFHSPQVE